MGYHIGKWTIDLVWATASPENSTYTVQFKWKAEKMEEQVTMATFFLDAQGKIFELYEVYNLYTPSASSIQNKS